MNTETPTEYDQVPFDGIFRVLQDVQYLCLGIVESCSEGSTIRSVYGEYLEGVSTSVSSQALP